MVVDKVEVDGIPRQKRRWGAGDTEKCFVNKRLLMGGGRLEKGTENDQETIDTGGAKSIE